MKIALYSLTSSLHSELMQDASKDPFIRSIEASMGCEFIHKGEDCSEFSVEPGIIFVRTGGTEGLFREAIGARDAVLLTSGQSNSLAASMEILSWLKSRGCQGEILHGSPELIAERLKSFDWNACFGESAEGTSFLRPLPPIDLEGIRLGVIGSPSDWLISSQVNYADVKDVLNAELIDIPMNALLEEIGDPSDMKSFKGSERIHEALKSLVRKFNLGGLTLRCFDLLDTVHNTGCLALARMNADGIPSSCEGDIPALLTMAWLTKSKGCPGFQCNLSRIEGNDLLFAHCTVPLSMVSSYLYDTHFESGIGTAIKGEMKSGEVEIVKIAPDLKHYVSIPGTLTANHSYPNLCRTQITVNAPGASDYFLRTPCANHHIISYR